MDKRIPINKHILRIVCRQKKAEVKNNEELASKLGVTLTDVENWLNGTEDPKQVDFDNLCDILKVEPYVLQLTSSEAIAEGQHLLILEYYVNHIIGTNDKPKREDARLVLGDIQDAAEVASAEEEVKQGQATIFSTPDSSGHSEQDITGSEE